MRSRFAIIGRSVAERQFVTHLPAAGVSLTFINSASSVVFDTASRVVFGYGIQAANPVKLDFLPVFYQASAVASSVSELFAKVGDGMRD
jgi:hypothetical protein